MAAVPRGACARCARAPFAPLHESRPCGPAVKWAPLPDPLPACAGRGDGERTLSLALPACAGARGWEMGGGSPPRSSPLSARAREAQWAVAPIPADESRAPPRSSLPRPAERGEGQGEGPTSFPRRHREVRCSPPAVRARGARGRASGSEPRPRSIKAQGEGPTSFDASGRWRAPSARRQQNAAIRRGGAILGALSRIRSAGAATMGAARGSGGRAGSGAGATSRIGFERSRRPVNKNAQWACATDATAARSATDRGRAALLSRASRAAEDPAESAPAPT